MGFGGRLPVLLGLVAELLRFAPLPHAPAPSAVRFLRPLLFKYSQNSFKCSSPCELAVGWSAGGNCVRRASSPPLIAAESSSAPSPANARAACGESQSGHIAQPP